MNSLLIAQNIIKRTLKSKKELIVLLILPIVAIVIMTYFSGSASSEKTNVGIVNLDKGLYANKLVEQLIKQKNLVLNSLGEKDVKASLQDSKVVSVIVIDNGFSKDIDSGKKITVDLYSDGVNENTLKIKQEVDQYISSLYMVSYTAKDIASKTDKSENIINNQLFSNINNESVAVNNGLTENKPTSTVQGKLVQSVGFSMMFIMVIIFNTMGTIIEDRKKLLLARTAAFDVKLWEIAVGNLLGTLIVGVIQIIPITLVIAYVYKLPIGFKLLGLFFILLCFILAVIGMAIGLSGIIKDDLNPSLIVATVSFPTCLLGGCLIPQSLMPSFMKSIGYIVPQKWVLAALQELMSGAALDKILFDLVIVLLFGLAFTTFGVKTIRPLDD
jgi:ABC-2 type transport system permease protein